MAATPKLLIPPKVAESSQTTQYIAAGVTTIIDKFTATNFSTVTANISVNLVTSADTAGVQNIVTKQKTLQPNEVYMFPELTGALLAPSGYISTLASASSAINIRANGREIT